MFLLRLRWVRLGWGLAIMGVFVLALLPPHLLMAPVFNWWDKAQHALAFAMLTGWGFWAWPLARPWVVAGLLTLGAAIELAQWVSGWRFAEWTDWAADAVGVFVVWGLVVTGRRAANRLRGKIQT